MQLFKNNVFAYVSSCNLFLFLWRNLQFLLYGDLIVLKLKGIKCDGQLYMQNFLCRTLTFWVNSNNVAENSILYTGNTPKHDFKISLSSEFLSKPKLVISN